MDEPLLSTEEEARIWRDLLTGPRPRRIHPEVKSALLEGLSPGETELVEGLLEIVETGGASIEDVLAEFDRVTQRGGDRSPRSDG
jgi:hypothetical protein